MLFPYTIYEISQLWCITVQQLQYITCKQIINYVFQSAKCKLSLVQINYYTGCFIMFSVITNISNKKTKGPTLMELFTATGKQKKFFFTTRDVRCVHHWWHGTHRYDIQLLTTRASTWVHQYSSLLQRSVTLGQRGHVAMVGSIPGLWHIPKEKNREYVSYGFNIINFCNPRVRYEKPCILQTCKCSSMSFLSYVIPLGVMTGSRRISKLIFPHK